MPRISILSTTLVVLILVLSGTSSGQSQDFQSKEIHAETRFIDHVEQIRQLWSSTIAQSVQLQALIHEQYPVLSPLDEENILDMIDDFVTPEHHYGSALALTEPSLEPTYPTPGRHIPPYLLPQCTKRQPSPDIAALTQSLRTYRKQLGNKLFEALRKKAEELVRCYRGYSLSLTRLQTCRAGDAPKLQIIENDKVTYRNKLVGFAGAKAIDQLDEQLGVSKASHKQ